MAEILTPASFRELTGVSRETLARLEIFVDLLRTWQKTINLVGDALGGDLWRRHMFDSAQLVPLIPESARTLVDLGSGAGFPGLILAMLAPAPDRWKVHLVESDNRKCVFLQEAARLTGTEVKIHRKRAEKLVPFAADVVTARALAPLPRLLRLAAPFLARDGVALCPKGAAVDRELTAAEKNWKIEVDRLPSLSDPSGTILRIAHISEVP